MKNQVKAEELIKRYNAGEHVENGLFIECHYAAEGNGRPASGSIYYYVKPGERTQFHKIDCDEYWSYNAGGTLELWVIGLDGKLRVKYCGITEGAEPTVRFAAGEIFASRLDKDSPDGTFVTCITVPRFSYDGFQLLEQEEITSLYPDTAKFWE